MSKYKNVIEDWIVSFFYSFFIVTVFSITTSWLYDKPLMYDSAIFQLIGKNWAEGGVPYIDLWEMKGPIAFLPSALGYWLTGTKMGLYFYQLMSLTFTLFIILRFYLLEFDRKYSILLTGLTAFYFVVLYESGNTVEEYLLPLLTYAFYTVYRYVNKCIVTKDYDLPCGYAFVYGCVLGFSLMSRLTNAISICAVVFVVGIMLVANRRWFNLLMSFVSFICGFLFLTVPFFVYFWSKGALQEMWYGTFLFGLEYASNSGFDIFSLFGLRHIFLRFANCYLLFIIAIIVLKYNPSRKFAGLMWLVVSIMTTLVFLRLNGFGHYYIITIPFIPIIFIEINELWRYSRKKFLYQMNQCLVIIYLVLSVVGMANNIKNFLLIFCKYEEMAVYEAIVEKMPSDFKSSFIAYDCDTELYLYFDISPRYPFYTLQSSLLSFGSSIKKKIEKCFSDGDAKYMLVCGKPTLLQDVIMRKYELLFSEESTRGGRYYVYIIK